MIYSSRPLFAACFLMTALCLHNLHAQDLGTGTGTTDGNSIGLPSSTGADGSLDADAAFEAVDRGDTVGSTSETGTGFSSVSVATQGGGAGALGGGLGGALGGRGLGGFGGLSGLLGGFNTQGQSAKPAIRTRLRSAVLYEPHPPERVQQRVGDRFRSLSRPEMRNVNVVMQGRTGILSGVVETEQHRRMSEMLMRLEPGVSNIVNQIQIASP